MIRRNKCFVPGCKTGCNVGVRKGLREGLRKKALFRAPSEKNLLERWKRNIPNVGKYLIPGCFVCEVHFTEASIERSREYKSYDGTTSFIRRSVPRLRPGSVPTIFPDLPAYLFNTLKKVEPPCETTSKPYKKKVKVVVKAMDNPVSQEFRIDLCSNSEDEEPINDNAISSTHNETIKNSHYSLNTVSSSKGKKGSDNQVSSSTQHTSISKTQLTENKIKEPVTLFKDVISKKKINNLVEKFDKHLRGKSISYSSSGSSGDEADNTLHFHERFQILVGGIDDDEEPFGLEKLKSGIHELNMPNPQWSFSCLNESVAFIKWAWYYETRKKIIVTKDLKYRVFVRDKELSIEGYEGPNSVEDVEKFLKVVDIIPSCHGITPERGWSPNCTGHIPYREEVISNTDRKRCDFCIEELKTAPNFKKLDEKRKKQLKKLSTLVSAERTRNKGLTDSVRRLKKKIVELKTALDNATNPVNILGILEMKDVDNTSKVYTQDGSSGKTFSGTGQANIMDDTNEVNKLSSTSSNNKLDGSIRLEDESTNEMNNIVCANKENDNDLDCMKEVLHVASTIEIIASDTKETSQTVEVKL